MKQKQLKKKITITFPEFRFGVKRVIYDDANSA